MCVRMDSLKAMMAVDIVWRTPMQWGEELVSYIIADMQGEEVLGGAGSNDSIGEQVFIVSKKISDGDHQA